MRAVASAAPPGAEVTMMLTGLVGKVCACGGRRDRGQRCSGDGEVQQFSHRFLPVVLAPHFPKSVSAIQSAVNGRNL